MQNTTFS